MNEKIKYRYEETTIEQIIDDYKDGKLRVPKIQRTLVWKDKDKETLQESIKNGFPFGVIFLHEINGQKYILDGLQRTSTILEIYQNIFKNMKNHHLNTEIETSIRKHKENNTQTFENFEDQKYIDFFKNVLKKSDWIKEIGAINSSKSTIFADKLKIKNKDEMQKKLLDSRDVGLIASRIYDIAVQNLGIENHKIQTIVFTGSTEEAAELFELINTKGKKLTNTDIWRTKWSVKKMEIENSDKIIKKMKESLVPAFECLSIRHEENDDLTPYDIIWYIFQESIGDNWDSHIARQFTGTVGSGSSKKSDEQIDISSLIYIIKMYLKENENNIEKINFWDEDIGQKIDDYIKDMEHIDTIIHYIKESIEIYNEIFRFFKDFKGNAKKDEYRLMPKGAYIVAYLGSIFKKIIEEKDSFNKVKFIKENTNSLNQYYIYDLLNKTFSSSSSNNAYEAMINDKYYKELKFDLFENQINIYFQSNKFDTKNFNDKSSVLMSMLYGDSITVSENSNNNFENDHLIPSSILIKNKINNISNFANFALLPAVKNNNKADKLSEKIIEDESLTRWAKKNNEEEYNNLMNAFRNFEKEKNQENYDEFLKARKNIILEKYKKDVFKEK